MISYLSIEMKVISYLKFNKKFLQNAKLKVLRRIYYIEVKSR